ncbi:aldehyde dehydrogenase family protein [Streptomyces sp. NPDC046215]|uniref:aldehyde dehydrogenase family protein n=1 Tax=Streptomyces sp. NPDC046215 TaxID=3155774 RepID=UPI0034053D97
MSEEPVLGQVLADAAVTFGLIASDTDRRTLVTDPSTGRPVAAVPVTLPADAERAAAWARSVHPAWQGVGIRERLRCAARLRSLLRAHSAALGPVLAHTCGLGPRDLRAEDRAAGAVLRRHTAAARACFAGPGPYGRLWPGGRPARRGRGAGAPAVVTAWGDPSRPLASLLEGALPALLAGSTVITRAAPRLAPAGAHMLLLAQAAGLPPGTWQLAVSAPPHTTGLEAALAAHTDRTAPQCCTPPPHGPAAPRTLAPGLCVVRHDARPRAAAPTAALTCFARAGRMCTATPVLVVHASLYEGFLQHFLRAAAHDYLADDVAVPAEAERLELLAWLDGAIADGARLLHPGLAQDATGRGPFVLGVPSPDHVRPGELPTGPLAVVTRYTSWSQVQSLARRTGGHTTVFTRTPPARLRPLLPSPPTRHLHLNTVPRPGLPPLTALRAITAAPDPGGEAAR